jgi:antitoxin HicB
MTIDNKSAEYYLNLPYTVILRRDEEGDVVARVDELAGCAAHGKTEHEALQNLREAQELWIQDCLEQGQPVPKPAEEEALPSGKWVQRVPRSLHKKLVEVAKRENVSLNQLTTSILSEAVGKRKTAQDAPALTDSDLAALEHTHLKKSITYTQGMIVLDWEIQQNPSRVLPYRAVVGILRQRLPNQRKLVEIKEHTYGEKQAKHQERRQREYL